MKPKYLKTYQIKELINFCNHKCVQIVYEQNSIVDKMHLKIYRDKYKGYLYCKKVTTYLLKNNKNIMNYELYNHFKYYRSFNARSHGENIALYDVINYLVEKFH